MKTLRIAFHVMQREFGQPGNFEETNPDHVAFLMAIFNRLNDLYTEVNAPACGGVWQPFLEPRDTRIRFQLEGIYYHKDDIGYNNNGDLVDPYCLNTYGSACADATFPVFFCQYSSTNSGYGPQTHIMMNGVYSYFTGTGAPGAWGIGNVLGHEFGHVFTLQHAWISSEKLRFPDICQPATSQQFCEPIGDPLCSNNVMARARLKDHFSPLQMAAMHEHILKDGYTKFLVHTYEPNQTVLIKAPGQTWETNRLINGDIVIVPGATLTIRSRVYMPPNGRIIVKRGARLIVEGGHITTKGPHNLQCNGAEIREEAMWWGIEVWGNTDLAPFAGMLNDTYALGENDPGVVILRAYGNCRPTLENAKRGIMTFPNDGLWEARQYQHGGLILAEDADFLNCRKGVEIISVHTAVTVSQFRRCRFYQNYLTDSNGGFAQTYEGATIWNTEGAFDASQQMSGLVFEDNCVFENLGRGIGAGNATQRVSHCTFTNCKYSTEFGQATPMIGKFSFFDNNQYTRVNRGLFGHGYRQAFINANKFYNSSHGVTLDGAGSARVQENEFRYTLGDPGPNFLDAIGMYQTGSNVNEIFCNQYFSPNSNENHILEGIYFEGDNRGATFTREAFDCWVDVRLVKSVNNGQVTFGQLPNQGNQILAPRNLFSNLTGHSVDIFTPTTDPAEPDGGTTVQFDYYVLDGLPTNSREIPRCPSGGVGFSATCPYIYNFWNEESSAGIGDCTTPRPRPCRKEDCLNVLQQEIRDKRTLLARSNAALLLQVQTAPAAPQTKLNIQAASPYLADDILLAILNSSALDSEVKYQYVSANTPVSGVVLATASAILSASYYNLLAAMSPAGSRTPRQLLEIEANAAEYAKIDALQFLTDSFFFAGNHAKVEQLLIADSTQASRQLRIGLKFQLDDLQGAKNLLEVYPIKEDGDVFFRQSQYTYWRLRTQPENFTLTAAEHDSLWMAAERHYSISGYAQTLLMYLEGTTFNPSKVPFEETGGARPGVEVRGLEKANALPQSADIRLSPNPVREVLTVTWKDNKAIAAMPSILKIWDSRGAEKLRKTMNTAETSIAVAHLLEGIYIIRIEDENGRLLASARFIKI